MYSAQIIEIRIVPIRDYGCFLSLFDFSLLVIFIELCVISSLKYESSETVTIVL